MLARMSDPTVLDGMMPLTGTLGIRFGESDARCVRAALDWAETLCTAGGALHGGTLMALADSAGAACAYLNLPEGAVGTTTVESKTNFLGPVRGGTVHARSTPLHVGRTLIVVDTELTDDRGRLVARMTQSQLVLGP